MRNKIYIGNLKENAVELIDIFITNGLLKSKDSPVKEFAQAYKKKNIVSCDKYINDFKFNKDVISSVEVCFLGCDINDAFNFAVILIILQELAINNLEYYILLSDSSNYIFECILHKEVNNMNLYNDIVEQLLKTRIQNKYNCKSFFIAQYLEKTKVMDLSFSKNRIYLAFSSLINSKDLIELTTSKNYARIYYKSLDLNNSFLKDFYSFKEKNSQLYKDLTIRPNQGKPQDEAYLYSILDQCGVILLINSSYNHLLSRRRYPSAQKIINLGVKADNSDLTNCDNFFVLKLKEILYDDMTTIQLKKSKYYKTDITNRMQLHSTFEAHPHYTNSYEKDTVTISVASNMQHYNSLLLDINNNIRILLNNIIAYLSNKIEKQKQSFFSFREDSLNEKKLCVQQIQQTFTPLHLRYPFPIYLLMLYSIIIDQLARIVSHKRIGFRCQGLADTYDVFKLNFLNIKEKLGYKSSLETLDKELRKETTPINVLTYDQFVSRYKKYSKTYQLEIIDGQPRIKFNEKYVFINRPSEISSTNTDFSYSELTNLSQIERSYEDSYELERDSVPDKSSSSASLVNKLNKRLSQKSSLSQNSSSVHNVSSDLVLNGLLRYRESSSVERMSSGSFSSGKIIPFEIYNDGNLSDSNKSRKSLSEHSSSSKDVDLMYVTCIMCNANNYVAKQEEATSTCIDCGAKLCLSPREIQKERVVRSIKQLVEFFVREHKSSYDWRELDVEMQQLVNCMLRDMKITGINKLLESIKQDTFLHESLVDYINEYNQLF